MVNRLFELSLLLNLTSISVYIPTLGVPSIPVSIGFVLVNLLYLVYHWPSTRRLIAKRSILEWTIYLAIWPPLALGLLTLARAPIDLVTSLKFILTLTSLMLASALYVYLRGWERFRRLATVALTIAALGFVLQWLAPSFFQRYTAEGGMPEFQGRTHGFFGGPNSAAQGAAMLTVVVVASLRRTGNLAKILPVLTMLVMVVATGSRSGVVLGVVTAAVLALQMSSQLRAGGRRLVPGVGAGALATAAGVLVLVGLLALGWLAGVMQQTEYRVLAERLAFWTEIGSPEDVLQDQSLATRLEAQRGYMREIAEQPILGYGSEQAREKVRAGLVPVTTHNLFLSSAFNYGVLYALFFIYLLWRLFWTRSVVPGTAPLARAASNVALVIVISGLATAGVMILRPVMAVLGAVLAAKAFPVRALKGTGWQSASSTEGGIP